MQTYHNNIFDITNSQAITTASVYVYQAGTGTLATLYEQNETTQIANPFDINDGNYDTEGNISFKAANGEYDVKAVVGGENYWKRYIQLYDPDDKLGTAATEDVGSTVGDVVQLEDVGGSPGLPAVDGSQLTNLPSAKTVWEGTPVGGVIGLATHLTGVSAPPTDNSDFRYVLLTAGQDGVGQYNEGVVTTESITGTTPLVVATAVIDDTGSPFNGETINLWNTENRYPKPGETAGVASNDQMQRLTGEMTAQGPNSGTQDGVFTGSATRTQNVATSGGSGARDNQQYLFDSANSPNARYGSYTDVKHETLVYYMRIR